MASAYSKRLAKLEELLAARINAPLAFIWMHAGESREEACARCGYDPAMVNRLRFVRWLTEEEATADPPLDAWAEPGPLGEDVVPDPVQELPAKDAVDLEAAERYRTAVERRAAELVAEKLAGATSKFAKTIA